jgi:polysaccharide biosynthesis protein PslH
VNVLIAAAAVPAPDRKGYQVRLYHQIIRLAARHAVTLVALAPDATVLPDAIREACESVTIVRVSRRDEAAAALAHAARLPLTVGYLQTPAMRERLSAAMRARSFEIAHFQMVRMAPYAQATARIPTVVDLVDALSVNMAERARIGPPVLRPALRLEALRLRRYERRIVPTFDRALIISAPDRAAIGAPNIIVNPNGVDALPLEANGPRSGIVFSGNMSYFANEDAVTWFIKEILPEIRRAHPTAAFTIVGRNPSERLRVLASRQHVEVTGQVPSTHRYLSHAAVAVCPMRFGSGIPTKILEAMAAGVPVVATPKAAVGLPADLQGLVQTASTPEAFAGVVVRLLGAPIEARALAEAAFDRIRTEHSWERSVAQLEETYLEAMSAAARSTR